jgi:allophanate hydrolase
MAAPGPAQQGIFRGMPTIDSFVIEDLLAGFRSARFTPVDVMDLVLERADQAQDANIWITRLTRAQILAYVNALGDRSLERQPLYGIPFVIKDNIDLAGVPTTAGCPAFEYLPARSAFVVGRLIDAGAIPIGKANLDQFATGLVGTRSPYGACRNAFNRDFIAGGSSSGSAVAVARGLASFSLGTDTAGSGRVPAGFNNIVGLKPSLGRLSCRGVVPACRSLDCVSIFALTAPDAARVLSIAEGFDRDDPYSRPAEDRRVAIRRIGIPGRDQLKFFGDAEYERLFDRAVGRLRDLGLSVQQIDASPFLEAAQLLYDGPWAAERYVAIEEFIKAHADAMHPVTRSIIEPARALSAADAFKGEYRLMQLRRASEAAWNQADAILCPTAGTIHSIREVEADPLVLNSNLGYYTNFVNLLDLAAVAVPAGFRADGLPFGVTIIGPRSTDRVLLDLAAPLHGALVDTLGAMPWRFPRAAAARPGPAPGFMAIAVCGAHMEGLPLNHEIRDRGGYCLRQTSTAACYRLYALPGGPVQRPGLVRATTGGASIEVEVWAIRAADVGSLVQSIPAPLGIGRIELEDGESVPGFLCEAHALDRATDITRWGGWRAYSSGQPACSPAG